METDKFDEENPPIEIPDEIVDDIDNDYDIKDGNGSDEEDQEDNE